MAKKNIPSPENTLAEGDPGDETAKRYRFQWTWAAVECCRILDDTEDVQEVFCEHHEDVLVKHKDGLYSGLQIKTRNDDQPVWKANDESIIKSCIRFAKLEEEFPDQFRSFGFLTNHPLHSAGTGTDISYILNEIKKSNSIENTPSKVQPWIKRIARKSSVDISITYRAMKKTSANAKLPKLRDATLRLCNTIAQCWGPASQCSHIALTRAANKLIEECGRASSLDHEQLMPAYLLNIINENKDIEQIIEGKKMNLSRVESLLEEGRDSTASLSGNPSLYVEPGSGSTELLHKKLDTAGFSVVSRNSAEDLRDKADYLGIAWTNKYGRKEGLKRYDHIRSVVLSDAGRAFDASQNEADNFGPVMRDDLRRRFHERRITGDQLYDTTDDHLEGVAFSLTSQCKVVWSHARPWEEE